MKSTTLPSIDSPKSLSTSLWIGGGLMILLGIAAIAAPLTAALAVDLLLGSVLTLAGVVALAFAWELRLTSGSIWRFLRAACYMLAGLMLLANPLSGIVTLALVLGALFIAEGVLQLVIAPQLESHRGLVYFDGALGIVLGIVILAGWPGDAAWIVGTLTGIRLIVTGTVLLMVGSAFRPSGNPRT